VQEAPNTSFNLHSGQPARPKSGTWVAITYLISCPVALEDLPFVGVELAADALACGELVFAALIRLRVVIILRLFIFLHTFGFCSS